MTEPVAETPITHPLDPISAAEVVRLKQILAEAGVAGETLRFSYVMLREPAREVLAAWSPGQPVPREIGVLVMDIVAQTLREMVVDIPAGAIVVDKALDPARDGWGPVLDEDYVAAEEISKADPRFVAALAERGITDLDQVFCCPLSAGVYGWDGEEGRRMLRVLSFHAPNPDAIHELWAHPIEGVVCHVDLLTREVIRFVDTGYTDIPQTSGDYMDRDLGGPLREDMKPLNITQPQGGSFTMEDNILRWQNWEIRVGFNGREGLTLHDISFNDRGRKRPIMNRASVSEMVVPYGEPQPTHEWQNYFDAGEYQFGRLANSLVLGCDCLGEIHYVDATVVDDFCNPMEIKNAICIHEEDFGTLWKHTCVFSGRSDVRRQRRLVVSFFVTVGNYDYGFYWYFYLDGKIELECKATGIVFTSGRPEGDYEWATEMAPRLGAPQHQHLFSARLDMAVDGQKNFVDEIDVARVPKGPGNPLGNAFTRQITRLERESDAQRVAKNEVLRTWRISSAETTNHVGEPPAFLLMPEGLPLLLADDDASITRRAGFATKSLWVTQFDRDELWAAGYTPNQHPGGAGLPSYAAADRGVDGEDIVVWHTFGLTHFPRTEDWPVMPVDYAGFKLRPENFFDRNPTLDVPEDPNGKECCQSNKTRAAEGGCGSC
ncbi:primary-amine oxidase [Pseudooceanicola marinus]|uniref:primary-amine oxidase n=1 Tax=Pseudooceanicola marinus TaxID=396013 RepID=UPI001CD69363|nr:primary-amine oxidase [Pseudooceanicola marinus]MCA1337531.1 primary-amine oxidase [Pseudooceanicola marinus]